MGVASQLGHALLALTESSSLITIYVSRDETGTPEDYFVSAVRTNNVVVHSNREMLSDALVAANAVVLKRCTGAYCGGREFPVELFARRNGSRTSVCKVCMRAVAKGLPPPVRVPPHQPPPDHPC